MYLYLDAICGHVSSADLPGFDELPKVVNAELQIEETQSGNETDYTEFHLWFEGDQITVEQVPQIAELQKQLAVLVTRYELQR